MSPGSSGRGSARGSTQTEGEAIGVSKGVMSGRPSIRGKKEKLRLDAEGAEDRRRLEDPNRPLPVHVIELEARAKEGHADVEPEPQVEPRREGRAQRHPRGDREPPR